MLSKKRLTRFVVCLVPAGFMAGALGWALLASYPPASAQQAPPANSRRYSSAPAKETSRPSFAVYACPPADARAIAARLRQEFGGVPGVRIAANDRLGQIYVDAPPEIRAQIARRLNTSTPNPRHQTLQASPTTPPAYPPSGYRVPRSQSVQLRYATAGQVEAGLAGALGPRLTLAQGAAVGVRSYRLSLPPGGRIDLSIDHQANQVMVRGTGIAVDSCVRLIRALDSPGLPPGRSVRLLSLRNASPASVQQVAAAISEAAPGRPVGQGTAPRAGGPRGPMVTTMFQPPVDAPEEENPEAAPLGQPPPANGAPAPTNGQPPPSPAGEGGLIGPVQIQMLPGLDVLVITGHARDVERVMEIIEEVERLSAETEPVIVVHRLRHVNSEALAELITPLYEEVYEPRQGIVNITALVKPNALLLVGRRENVQTVVELVRRLDRPVAPEMELQVFRLKHAAATAAQTAIAEFFGEEPTGLGTRVMVTADYRSNSLIVRASPRDMREVARLIDEMDTPETPAVNELRVFELFNVPVEDVEQILREAISGQAAGPAAPGQQAEQKSAALQFVTIDGKGRRRLKSGILTDVRITSNPRANTLVVSGPAESMELIAAVIRQLDQPPVAKAEIKVFHIANGDATFLRTMLEGLFGTPTAGEPAVQTAAVEGESSLVPLRFVEDVRTNSIIASGTAGDLLVVDAILTWLDESEARERKTEVYRLKNAPAADVANAVNTYLQNERAVLEISPEMMSPYEQLEREVVVVPELVTNSLIVSATQRYFEEIMGLVKQLDERPPMVMIQVLIAEVALNDADEFGVELGLQDSVLFDRSLLEVLDTISTTTTDQTPGGATTTTQTDEIVSASITPGFAFNNQPLPNTGSDAALAAARVLASQGLSHFGVGRLNSELGYGGLVLSASSDIASILVRALKENRRLDVLSRPQIMTLDNQPAMIVVGQQVRFQESLTVTPEGLTQFGLSSPPENVGIILGVTPRVSPDDVVIMEIDAVKSEVAPVEQGIPISISPTGEQVRSPSVNTIQAQTTVAAADGQTVVLGGLIAKSKSQISRKVPCLGDIPVLGALFRYDGVVEKRTELLIIMTPHVVRTEQDAELLKQTEAARMHWCLCDVLELSDDPGIRSRTDEWLDCETNTVYPGLEPDAQMLPIPSEVPGPQPTVAPPNGAPGVPESTPGPNGTQQQPTPGGAEAPSAQTSSRVYPAVPRPTPSGTGRRLPAAQPAYYQPQAYPGAARQPTQQWAGGQPQHAYSAPGSAIQLGYDLPQPQYQRPAGPPARPYQSPAAQPAQYYQPYQQPTAERPVPQTPLYR